MIVISEPDKKVSIHLRHESGSGKPAVDHDQLTSITSKTSNRNLPLVDDMLRGKSLTFEELTKLDYKQFNNPKVGDSFKPSDILDFTENDSEDEILRKFKIKKNSSQK